MKTMLVRCVLRCACVAGVLWASSGAIAQTYAQFKGHKLPMIQRGVLANTEGRLGSMALDPKSGRMYVAATRAGSLEALDATGMRTAQSVKDLPDPSGVVFMPETRRLAVACGDGAVRVFKADDAGQLTLERAIQLRGEADQIVFEPGKNRLWVGHGKFLSLLDPEKDAPLGQVKMPDFPEGLALDPASNRLYVNIAKRGEVVVVDRDKGEITETWTLKDAKGNYAIALDSASKRLFVGATEPGCFIALDAASGKEVARLDIPGDAGSMWYDAPGKRIYIASGGGGGKVVMVLQSGPDSYAIEHQEGTMAGASMSLLLGDRRRLIVTAPKMADQPTFVYTFLIPP